MDSDADRLAMIKSLGGQLVRVRGAELWGVFDNSFGVFEGIEGTVPAFTCRTSDCERIAVIKDDPIEIGGKNWRVKRVEHDGTGMSALQLREV